MEYTDARGHERAMKQRQVFVGGEGDSYFGRNRVPVEPVADLGLAQESLLNPTHWLQPR